MCGIIGYSGKENAVPILVSSLHALEYRGYDSSGISVLENGNLITVKAKGRIAAIEERLFSEFPELYSNCGIGHTRWATHGAPSDVNSHPHCTENITLVHNGIIENYSSLKERLAGLGYTFISETDTEAALKLIDFRYKETGNPICAVKAALDEIEGSYAFGIMFRDLPGKIYAVKKDSPLIIAKGQHGSFIASDLPAVLKYTNCFYRTTDGEIAVLDDEEIKFYSRDGDVIEKSAEKTDMTFEQAEKSGFPHFMLKEICEEPTAIHNTLRTRIPNSVPELGLPDTVYQKLCSGGQLHIVACGTAMHAGLIGKYFIEKLARIKVDVTIASEFRYNKPILSENDVFIALSQSGETADTLAALRLARTEGLYIVAVVNVQGSTIASEADKVIVTHAGPEIAVASTKAYTVQTAVMYCLALSLANRAGRLDDNTVKKMTACLLDDVPAAINEVIADKEKICTLCDAYTETDSLFYIGRGIDYALAMEASLKLKEISYIHCEAYAAGELKHGTISLITGGTDVIAVITEQKLLPKILSNIKEVKARGARVTVICDGSLDIPCDICDSIIRVPHVDFCLTALPCAAAFQLLAYFTAVKRGCDVDKPRNLAKSVTVE